MDGNGVFADLSRYFLNEEVTKSFTRRRILKQIRESIVSKVVTKSSTDVFHELPPPEGGGFLVQRGGMP